MIIRDEIESDIEAITAVTIAAFENHPYSRNTEQFIIHALRAANALTISMVAEIHDQLVGHIAFSPVNLSDGCLNWYGLGPVSVLPGYQKQGIGKSLLNKGLDALKAINAKGCVLVGDPNYYQRFGFASPTGLSHEGVPQENFMVLTFHDNEIPQGTVTFHEAFAATC